ncbi:MAG: hypothetical protein LC539_15825 [Candidatus Thiodiazotropha sp.]|nr:hypothetical protein [Candidatus Thiodiazotropha sp.]MCM8920922.1 hypothetical protein [Candidatus Thiodiazotropha sp.]
MMKNNTKPRSWPSWINLVLGLIVILILFVKLSTPILSNDIWWHMVLGQEHLNTGSLITDHSAFTWSPATSYHAYSSWLADIVLYLIHESAGISGLLILRYAVFLGIFLLALHFAVKRGVANNPLTWLVILTGFGICLPSSIIKPELFSLYFMVVVIWLYYHLRATGDRAWGLVYLFPLIITVWANTHGAFFLSALFFAATIMGELLNLKYSPDQAMSERLRRHYFYAMFLCLPAILVNPYGIELLFSIVNLVLTEGAQVYSSRIGAYQPTSIFNVPPHYMLDYMILAMVLFVVLLWQKMKLRQTDWVVILSFMAYCLLFVQMVRTTYYLSPVFMFAALDMLRFKDKSSLWPNKNSGKYTLVILSSAAIGFLVWRFAYYEKSMINDPVRRLEAMQVVAHRFPHVEANYIESNLQGDRVGNLYDDGGYLIHRLWPEKKVLIDPRYFPFKAWIGDYFRFASEAKGIPKFLNRMKADYWLINYEKITLFEWFIKSNDWELAFFGPIGSVFVPVEEFNGATITSSEISNLPSGVQLSRVLNAALVRGNIDLAKDIREIAKENIDNSLSYKHLFLEEIDNIILGMEALDNGEYEKAAAAFSNTRFVSYGALQSAGIYRYLAAEAWQDSDYLHARKWSINAYLVTKDKNILDMYNMVLTDWHTRHQLEDAQIPDDQVEWEKFADLILQNRKMLESDQFLAIVEAMKNDSYAGDGNLFQQSQF